MKIYHNFEEAGGIRNAVVTTGSFDGVHIGHKVIINRLKKIAVEVGGETVLITFYPHPRKVLYPDTVGKDLMLINSQQEKIELLRKAGVDHLVIVDFTLEFSKTTSNEFIKNILLQKLHARKIVIGFNHHFGHNREGDYAELHRLGEELHFEVEEIPEQDIQNESVSSTKIRRALLEGNIQKANAYLDHQYIIKGMLKKSDEVLEQIGFPSLTMSIEEDCKLVPPNGVYAVTLEVDADRKRGMCFIRSNDHNARHTLVDTYLFDGKQDAAGETGTLLFHKRIREEKLLSNAEELKKQLVADKAQIEDLIY